MFSLSFPPISCHSFITHVILYINPSIGSLAFLYSYIHLHSYLITFFLLHELNQLLLNFFVSRTSFNVDYKYFKNISVISETAINIGYSCQLLTDDMAEVFIIDGMTYDEVERQLAKCRDSIRVVNTFLPHGTYC